MIMLTNYASNYIAGIMLGVMFLMLFFSAWNDSATMDELAHIPAGYSYLTKKDMRLNPEHPPLIKDLAAFPLLFLNLKFPSDHSSWTEDVNGQWTSGAVFLYESGNDADQILRYSRLPIMLLAVLFGFLLFLWVRLVYGNKIGLLTLFFFSFSPTFIAHSRYVTTDLGAAFGFFIGIAAFVKFLEKEFPGGKPFFATRADSFLKRHKPPHKYFSADDINSHQKQILTTSPISSKNFLCGGKYLIICGIAFGIAETLKFSLFILAPLYLLYGAFWAFLWQFEKSAFFKERFINFIKNYIKIFLKTLLIFLTGTVIIWLVYAFHIWNYPQESQVRDTEFILSSFGVRPLVDFTVFMAENKFLRPLAEYLLGLLMVIQRASGGNTTYFMGQISAAGWWYYFPVAYILKETLAFQILAVLALIVGIKIILKSKNKSWHNFFEWLRDNFSLTAGIIFIIIYWTQSILSPLNIGLRHILPTFPFIYLLVSREIMLWIHNINVSRAGLNLFEKLKFVSYKYAKIFSKYGIISVFLLWIFLSAVFTFPNYLSYYNELVGGTKNGYKYITDSNYDWGQDLKRLKYYAEDNKIDKIYIDYFGGGSPKYYFGENFYGWNAGKGEPEAGAWLAVSATFRQGSIAESVKGFEADKSKTYYWLKNKEPTARAGTSIFIYKF